MLEIGDCVRIKEDHRFAFIYDVFKDTEHSYYYQIVWFEDDLYKPWPKNLPKIIFWDSDLFLPKTRKLKNGNTLIISR